MGAPKLKKFNTERRSSDEVAKGEIAKLKQLIGEKLTKDQKVAKKAAQLITELLNFSKEK